ncbi:hypothetical protein [Pyrobaculum aerophilum]|uniref:Uncharacterized protein n=1 Tax=Pyrobaculum aerophilum TaxID=13773 RepID=A0A371R0F5_9CREN|nr:MULTISPECIES: hypothetical protein [Pyrobaculum]MCX8136822.1 hypothetical protein [Pyrobaculum aerophilum]RFA94571.1 hypothetical protein CGL52_14190 [Pyrobaculum aerophilum]RFA96766.1 hypothetical protein CGL51_04410 [Pyrobaculum aerophilum]
MLEIVIGSVVEDKADRHYTICEADKATGVGFELTPEGQLVFTTIFLRYNYPTTPFRHTADLLQCSNPLCLLFRFADFSELQEEPGKYQLKIAMADPVALAFGLALSHYLDAKHGGGWLVEVYSDAWPMFTDLLVAAKPLQGVLRIYTSVYDQRVVVADRVVYNLRSVSLEALAAKRQWEGGKTCRVTTPEFATVAEKEVLEVVREVWEAGGFMSLKYAQERFGQLLIKAVNAGFLRLDTATMAVKITELGVRALDVH